MSQGRMSVFSLPLISSFLKRFLLLLLVAVFVSYRSCYSTYSAMVVAGSIHDLNTISVFFSATEYVRMLLQTYLQVCNYLVSLNE